MKLNLVNNSKDPMPRLWINQWLKAFHKQLPARHFKLLAKTELTVVFLDEAAAKKINSQFRKRNYATDVLSFQSDDPKQRLGELLLCPQVLKAQAKDHKHSFKAELGYMLIHGVLHLLGYDHEAQGLLGRKKAKQMYKLQDQVFDSLRLKFHV